jgi:predicted MPP superfamily phosphohydrolase
LLLHFPTDTMIVDRRFDLILAGHSHGGQVRLPILGALVLPEA